MKVLVRGEETEGRITVLQDDVPPKWGGPPLHQHDWDETFFVLAGKLTFQVENEIVVRSAGEVALAARGVPHTFANRSDEPASYLVMCTPAGFERYFDPEPRGPLPKRHAVGPPISTTDT